MKYSTWPIIISIDDQIYFNLILILMALEKDLKQFRKLQIENISELNELHTLVEV